MVMGAMRDGFAKAKQWDLDARRRFTVAILLTPASLLRVDVVEKVFSYRRAQTLRAVRTPIRKLFGGIHHQAMNSPMTSVVALRAHRMATVACFVFQREISRTAFREFCNTICQQRTSTTRRKGCELTCRRQQPRASPPYFSSCRNTDWNALSGKAQGWSSRRMDSIARAEQPCGGGALP